MRHRRQKGREEEKELVGGARAALLLLLIVPAGAAYLGTNLTFGRDVDPRFYEIVAQIIPVLVLALAVELRGFAERGRAEAASEGWFAFGRMLVLSSTLWCLLGEAVSLYAVATGESTTFSLLVASFAATFLLLLVAVAFFAYYA